MDFIYKKILNSKNTFLNKILGNNYSGIIFIISFIVIKFGFVILAIKLINKFTLKNDIFIFHFLLYLLYIFLSYIIPYFISAIATTYPNKQIRNEILNKNNFLTWNISKKEWAFFKKEEKKLVKNNLLNVYIISGLLLSILLFIPDVETLNLFFIAIPICIAINTSFSGLGRWNSILKQDKMKITFSQKGFVFSQIYTYRFMNENKKLARIKYDSLTRRLSFEFKKYTPGNIDAHTPPSITSEIIRLPVPEEYEKDVKTIQKKIKTSSKFKRN